MRCLISRPLRRDQAKVGLPSVLRRHAARPRFAVIAYRCAQKRGRNGPGCVGAFRIWRWSGGRGVALRRLDGRIDLCDDDEQRRACGAGCRRARSGGSRERTGPARCSPAQGPPAHCPGGKLAPDRSSGGRAVRHALAWPANACPRNDARRSGRSCGGCATGCDGGAGVISASGANACGRPKPDGATRPDASSGEHPGRRCHCGCAFTGLARRSRRRQTGTRRGPDWPKQVRISQDRISQGRSGAFRPHGEEGRRRSAAAIIG